MSLWMERWMGGCFAGYYKHYDAAKLVFMSTAQKAFELVSKAV